METSIILEHGWLCYNQGLYAKAMEYFLQAADKGSANAINAIALVYYHGKLYEKNLQKAARWFRYAADMGYASAQRNYADCLRKGEGVPVNLEEAFSWYMRASDKGNIKAQYMMANVPPMVGVWRKTLPKLKNGTKKPFSRIYYAETK